MHTKSYKISIRLSLRIPVPVSVNYYNIAYTGVANFTDFYRGTSAAGSSHQSHTNDIYVHYSPVAEIMLYCNRSMILQPAGVNRRRVIDENDSEWGDELMEETMKDYEKELEASFRTINEGDVIKGTVLAVNEEEVILDLKYYTQGIIKAEDMSNDPNFSLMADVHEGDVLEATVVKTDDGQGNILLSRKEANDVLAWDVLAGYMEEKKNISVKVNDVVNAGVVAYLEGIRGFIPASHLDISYVENLEEYKGKTLEVRVITVDREKEKLVLSAREILREKKKEEHDHKVAMIVPGTVLEGTVESLQTYGAFVDLKDGLSGLVHISQICQRRIKKPSEVLKVGDKVKVKVLNTNDGKISLSMKALEEQQAEEIEKIDVKQYGSSESVGTSLGDLFAKLNIK